MPVQRPPIITVPELSPGKIRLGIIAALLAWGVFSSVYTVPAESKGVILRFGECLTEMSGPGLHFKMPFGMDKVFIVPVERQLKMEFGFNTQGATNPDQIDREPFLAQQMITGDQNSALVQWVVQYRIIDPRQYLLRVESPGETLRDLCEAVMQQVVGDRTVDEVITIGRQEIEGQVRAKLAEAVVLYELGVAVSQVQLKDVDPPEPVQESFDEVNKAQQDKEAAINVANGEYNKSVPRARGEAEQQISAAEGAALKRINESEGDVASFKSQLEQYTKAPDITRTRLYLETLGAALPQAGAKVIIDESVRNFLNIPASQLLPAAAATMPQPSPYATPSSIPRSTPRSR